MSSLRSKVVLKYHKKLADAAKKGFGVTVEEMQRISPNRSAFGPLWELRRWGAELVAVRQARTVAGWILKSELPENPRRMKKPTPQSYVNYDETLFAHEKPKTAVVMKKKMKPSSTKSPFVRGSITNAGKRLIEASAASG